MFRGRGQDLVQPLLQVPVPLVPGGEVSLEAGHPGGRGALGTGRDVRLLLGKVLEGHGAKEEDEGEEAWNLSAY